jgi:adenylate kinase
MFSKIKKLYGGFMSDYELKQELLEQKDQIRKLASRLSQMADQNKTLENDITTFKTRVSKDILDIVEYLKKNKK